MRMYGQYCPLAQGSELLGDRWTPLILREMILGSTRFNDIERGLPGISRTLLIQRLRHLERNGVVEIRPMASGRGNGYHLTPAGRDLEPVLMAMGDWIVRWKLAEPTDEDVDPVTLTWWMRRRLDVERLPDRRVVIEFRYGGGAKAVVWLVLDPREPNVCQTHPGFESDVIVTTDAVSFTRVFLGLVTLTDAVRTGTVRVEGPPALTRAFPTWFLWSPFHPAVRAHLAETAGST
jgi:DNA-binding HxlR family transcriptional regulator